MVRRWVETRAEREFERRNPRRRAHAQSCLAVPPPRRSGARLLGRFSQPTGTSSGLYSGARGHTRPCTTHHLLRPGRLVEIQRFQSGRAERHHPPIESEYADDPRDIEASRGSEGTRGTGGRSPGRLAAMGAGCPRPLRADIPAYFYLETDPRHLWVQEYARDRYGRGGASSIRPVSISAMSRCPTCSACSRSERLLLGQWRDADDVDMSAVPIIRPG